MTQTAQTERTGRPVGTVRRLAGYIRQYKLPSILTPACMAGEVFMEMLIPFVMASLIDKGITPGNVGEVIRYGLIMLGMAFLSLFFGVMGARTASKASTGLAANVRQAIYEKVQTFSFANIDRFSTAGLVTRMTTDVTNVQNAFQMLLRIAVRAPLMMIGSLVVVSFFEHGGMTNGLICMGFAIAAMVNS